MKSIIGIAAALLLSACSGPTMTLDQANKVQKACADIGLVSSVQRGGPGDTPGVASVKCYPAGGSAE